MSKFLKKKLKMGSGASSDNAGGRPGTAGGNEDANKVAAPADAAPPTPDSRLPFQNYRELFTMKNFWKTVKRNEDKCSKALLSKFLATTPAHRELYTKLADVNFDDDAALAENKAFEKMAMAYFLLFDDVVNGVESSPTDCSDACTRLRECGKGHKGRLGDNDSGSFQGLEEPFLKMVADVLEDRYTDKAESLFRKFFQFCLKYVVEGYNS